MKPLAALLICFAATPAFAGHDRILAGDNVLVTGDVSGDVIAAGGNVSAEAVVDGDVVVFGGDVRVAGTVKDDVYVAGGDVVINGDVNGSLRVAGGDVRIDPKGHVGGNASVAGGETHMAGRIDGDLRIAGGEVQLDGTVTGDVRATGGDVTLGPNARIGGKLTYSSKDDLVQDPGAVVTGGVVREEWRDHQFQMGHAPWFWSVGLAFTALLILGIGPGFAARVTDTVHDEFPGSLLFGLVALIAVPIAALICAVTIIGLPLALIVLSAYPILLLLGYVLGLIAAGDIGLQRVRRDKPLQVDERGARILAALVAIVVVALVGRVPVIGGLVTFVVLLLGMGALVQQFSRKRRQAAVAA